MPRGNPNLAAVRPKGRKKGSKNKFTTIKRAVEGAFEALGGQEYLELYAKKEPAAFFSLIGRLLPKSVEVSGPDQGPIVIRTNVPKP